MARRLAVNVTTPDESGRMVTYMAGDEVPDAVAKGITRDDVYEGGDEGYDSQTVDDLKAEIDKRNEGRDGDAVLSKSGNKADLIAALEADDSK